MSLPPAFKFVWVFIGFLPSPFWDSRSKEPTWANCRASRPIGSQPSNSFSFSLPCSFLECAWVGTALSLLYAAPHSFPALTFVLIFIALLLSVPFSGSSLLMFTWLKGRLPGQVTNPVLKPDSMALGLASLQIRLRFHGLDPFA